MSLVRAIVMIDPAFCKGLWHPKRSVTASFNHLKTVSQRGIPHAAPLGSLDRNASCMKLSGAAKSQLAVHASVLTAGFRTI